MVFLLLFALGTFPVLTLHSWATKRHRLDAERTFDHTVSALATGLAESGARFLEDRRRMLDLVRLDLERDPDWSADRLAPRLEAQVLSTASFTALELTHVDGRPIAGAVAGGLKGERPLRTPDTTAFWSSLDRTGTFAWSQVVPVPGTDRSQVLVALPVHSPEGHTDGVLVGGVEVAGLAREVRSAVPDGDTRVVVVDHGGRVVVDSAGALELQETADHGFGASCPPSSATVRDEHGAALRAACVQVPVGTQLWAVWVSGTHAVVEARSASARASTRLALGGNLILLGLISLAVAMRLRSHLEQFRASVDQLGEGSLDVPIPTSTPFTPREIRDFRDATRRMLERFEAADLRSKKLVAEVATANQQLRPLAEAWAHLGEAIEILDADGRILFANPACVEALGPEACETGRASAVLEGDVGVRIADAVARRKSWTGEVEVDGPQGRRLHAVTVSPVYGDAGLERMIVIRWDLTDQRTAESMAAHSERLASVGTLAAGMAHEIYNPLTYVLLNLEVLRVAPELVADPDLVRAVEESLDGVGQIQRLVQELLLLSRDRPRSGVGESRQVVPVRQIVDSAVTLAQARVRDLAEVKVQIDGDPHMRVRVSEATQVLVNLLINAGLASPPGPHRSEVRVTARREGTGDAEMVVIDVRDSGVGMTPEELHQAFLPFYTTREVGQGTGLGLAVARGIVDAHGGTLSAQSAKGVGSVFTVRLPASQRPQVLRPQFRPAERLRLLLVDDDKRVVESIARALSDHECTVAIGGFEGLDRLEEQTFDAVLSDVMMPDLNGPSLFEEVSARWPELVPRFAFVTGAPRGSTVARAVEQTGCRVFHKPVRRGELDTWLQGLDLGRPRASDSA